jgi:hypothetical protein
VEQLNKKIMTIRDIIDSEKESSLLLEVFESFIKKAKSLGNRPLQGYGRAEEQMKKDKWLEKAENAEKLLSKIMAEMD